MKSVVSILGLALVLTGCGSDDKPAYKIPRGYSDIEICRATISAVMNKSPSIMETNEYNGTVGVGYERPSDQTHWNYKCRVHRYQGRVDWGGSNGRWREEIKAYTREDGKLAIEDAVSGHQSVFTHKELEQ